MDSTAYVGPDPEQPQPLTAPEYAVLLADNEPDDSDVVRAALVEGLARDLVRLHEGLLLHGPETEDVVPAALQPVRPAVIRAPMTRNRQGNFGVRASDWEIALRRISGRRGYVSAVVRPALAARGLLDKVPRRFGLGSTFRLSDDGRGTAAQARVAVDHARTVAEPPAGGWQPDSPTAAAAVAALGALGALALADPALVAVLLDLRRVGVSTDDVSATAAFWVGTSGVGFAGLAAVNAGGLGGLDAGFAPWFDTGGLGGSDLGGSDSGGFGGFDGGGFGGGDGGGGGGGM